MIFTDIERDINGRFIKGHKESKEIKQKRVEAMSAAWENREDYIADIKQPYIYNAWRSIRFNVKGKQIGNSIEWNNYRNFYNDVSPTYKEGYTLQRINKSLAFSSDNFIWVSKWIAPSMRDNAILITYKNESQTVSGWALKLHCSARGIYSRYREMKNGKCTIEEVLYGKKSKSRKKLLNARELEYQKLKDKASKMCSAYRTTDRKKHLNCDLDAMWLIENILKKKCFYCGTDEFIGCDRIDNAKGHTKENVIPCCYVCNVVRSDNFTISEMQLLGKLIAEIREKREIDKN